MQKFPAIIERVERIRQHLGLNRSLFARALGLTPQTYGNFVGKQESKPSIDLILGLVQRLGVDPYWLLNGEGEPFKVGAKPNAGLLEIYRSEKTDMDVLRGLLVEVLRHDPVGGLREVKTFLARLGSYSP